MIGPWSALGGSVAVALFGQSPESVSRVVGDLYRNGVVLTDLKVRGTSVEFSMKIADVSRLRAACKGKRMRVRFGIRTGFPFLVQRALRRKSFFLGLAVFAVTLHALGSMVWRVSVTGVEGDTASQLMLAAKDIGLRPGAWSPSLPEVSVLQDRILHAMPNLLWVGVHVTGGVADIEAIEKVSGVKRQNLPPQNIVATKTAVIRRVFATRGEVLVHPGQVVYPGQVIVSGSLAGGAVHVAAEGRAVAEVWYTSNIVVPLKTSRHELSGEYVTRHYVSLGNWHVRVWGFEQPNYPHQVDVVHDDALRIGSWNAPIGWRTVRVYEVGSNAFAKSTEQAKRVALQLVLQDVRTNAGPASSMLSQRVLQQQVSHGKLYETVLTQIEEDIGMQRPISLNQPNPLNGSQKPTNAT